MIIDDLENFNIYVNLHPGFKKVEEYLNKLDSLNPGCHEICGKNIYVNIDVYKTKKQNESIAEAHRKYIDVQIILQGYEKIGYSDIKTGKTLVEYDSEKDVEFLSADCDYINAKKGKFFIFYPQDIHHPCITNKIQSEVKKAVFKIMV